MRARLGSQRFAVRRSWFDDWFQLLRIDIMTEFVKVYECGIRCDAMPRGWQWTTTRVSPCASPSTAKPSRSMPIRKCRCCGRCAILPAYSGPKFGCGIAACGACTVHIDGAGALLLAAGRRGHGRDPHHRRPCQGRQAASGAAGLARRAGRAMRLLPGRADHERGGAARRGRRPDRRGHRQRHGRQSLPLRHLSAHPRRHQEGAALEDGGESDHGQPRTRSPAAHS